MRGFIGHFEEGNLLPHTHHTYLYTHYDFYFEYNEDHVSVMVTCKSRLYAMKF